MVTIETFYLDRIVIQNPTVLKRLCTKLQWECMQPADSITHSNVFSNLFTWDFVQAVKRGNLQLRANDEEGVETGQFMQSITAISSECECHSYVVCQEVTTH